MDARACAGDDAVGKIQPEKNDKPRLLLDGFEVVDSGDQGMGRIAIASRDFEAGERVLVESPAYVLDPTTGNPGMLQAFLEASEARRNDILDMCCPSIIPEEGGGESNHSAEESTTEFSMSKTQQVKNRLQKLEQDYGQFSLEHPPILTILPLEDAKRLARILDVNAHSLSLKRSNPASPCKKPAPILALFARGSKVEHSCHPNLTWAAQEGTLQYSAARPIAKGERVSISYLASIGEQPRQVRRDWLQRHNDFMCECDRCCGPDECNPYVVSCPHCDHPEAVAFTYLDKRATTELRCIGCQSTLPLETIAPHLKLEQRFERQLDQIDYGLESGAILNEGPGAVSRFLALQGHLAETFHSLHWLHPKSYRLVRKMAVAFARYQLRRDKKEGGGDNNDKEQAPSRPNAAAITFLCVATMTGLFRARWIQQVSNIGNGNSTLKHTATNNMHAPKLPKVPSLEQVQRLADDICEATTSSGAQFPIDMAYSLFHAGQDWLRCAESGSVALFYRRMLPLFHRWVGLGEENREKMLLLIESDGKEIHSRSRHSCSMRSIVTSWSTVSPTQWQCIDHYSTVN